MLTIIIIISHTSKNSHVGDSLLSPTPCFFWHSIHHCFCRTPIQNICCTIYSFSPIVIWKMLCLQHASRHIHDGPVLPFSNSILLWGVPCCKLLVNSILSTKS